MHKVHLATFTTLLAASTAMAVPYGVSVDSEAEIFGTVPVPTMRKARGFKGVVELDGPWCTIASSDLNRNWDIEVVADEVAVFDHWYQWSYSEHGQYQTAVECCWREGARLIGWSPIEDTGRLASVCAFGMRPLKPVAYEKRRAAALLKNRHDRRGDRHPETVHTYQAPVAQQEP